MYLEYRNTEETYDRRIVLRRDPSGESQLASFCRYHHAASMKTVWTICAVPIFAAILSFSTSCRENKKETPPDHPRLTPSVATRDSTFRSAALGREMQFRVILPLSVPEGQKLPVVYLLHGGGGGFRDWSNYSDVARFAEGGLVLVMPEGGESYYTNAADRPQGRYEDYILNDLMAEVEAKLPVATGRENRAIVGVSMGGFAAVKFALKRPDLFAFAAGISPAVDVPSRPFSIKRPLQWRYHRSIFGPWGGRVQQENDPFVLARSTIPGNAPYLFLTCGDREGLLSANRRLAAILAERHFQHEFRVVRGGHDWTQWNGELADCFKSLTEHLDSANRSHSKFPHSHPANSLP